MNEPFELLGSSQTFLGVLVTIIILFIIEDKTNLITYILKEIGLKLKKQIEALTITTSLDDSVLQSSDYKLLKYFMNNDDSDKDLHEEGAGLLAKISTERAKFQVRYINVENKDLTLFDKIVGAKEILLAPLYTLFFTITIFIFDELFNVSSTNSKQSKLCVKCTLYIDTRLLGNMQYAAIAPSMFTMKLSKLLCLECPTCAMFFNSSFTVSIIARFLSSNLSDTLTKAPFMLLLSLVISCMPSTNMRRKRFLPI